MVDAAEKAAAALVPAGYAPAECVGIGAARYNRGMSAPSPGSLESLAHAALLIPARDGPPDAILWRRAVRLSRLVGCLARVPEMADVRHELRAAETAALFFEIGRHRAHIDGIIPPDELMTAAVDDALREAGVDALTAVPAALLSETARSIAIAAIRGWNRPAGPSGEALLLAEAVHLDDLGPLWLWHEARRGGSAMQTLDGLLTQWRRRQDYGYWDARIREVLRFEWSRQLARRRVAAMQVFVESLAEQVGDHS